MRSSDAVIEEIVELRRKGFRFIALADDNFYPVALNDLRMADRRADKTTLLNLQQIRDERFELMERLAKLPRDMVFFTQITMEAAEDPQFLAAMKKANIKGALVGVESVTPEGLKDVYKDFNFAGEELVARLRQFRQHGVHVLGSFIFGLPSDRPETFEATAALAQRADVTFAQFVMLTPFPGTVDFERWEENMAQDERRIAGVPDHPPLADPAGAAAQGVLAASGDERRRDPQPDAGRLGQLLQPAQHLEALELHAEPQGAAGIRLHLEAVPADVRQHRDRHRQRPRVARGEVGAPPGAAHAPPVHRHPDAGAAGPELTRS